MNRNPKLTRYVSEIDLLLQETARKLVLSNSQQKEIKKSARISLLRDHPEREEPTAQIWDKF